MEENKRTGYPSIDKPWLKYYCEEAISAPLPEGSIYEYMYCCNKPHLHDVALNYFGRKIKYSKLFARIIQTAKAFAVKGVKRGDIVSLCVLNMPEAVYVIYALSYLGAISNIIEPRTDAGRIKERINSTHSRVLVVVDAFYEKVKSILIDTQIETTVVLSLTKSMPLHVKVIYWARRNKRNLSIQHDSSHVAWDSFLSAGKCMADIHAAKQTEDLVSTIIYTGGTTGIPKGAMLSNLGINTMVLHQKSANNRMQRGDTFLDIMPPFIAYGFVCGLHIPLSAGMIVVLVPKFSPQEFPSLIQKCKPNHVMGVPSFWEMLANSSKNKANLDFIKSAITGGDRLSPTTEYDINSFFGLHGCQRRIAKGYGMTELCSSAAYADKDACNKIGSAGIPLVKNTCKIVDPGTERELVYRKQGEICFSGPTMMLGYYGNEIETDLVMKRHGDGLVWIHTGDIGYMDEDGVLFIIDRMKRMIIRPDGHNVWPSQIEAVISQYSSVAACAVVGKQNPDGANGQIPTAYIVLKEGVNRAESLKQEIDVFSKKHLPERDVALAYNFIDALPLTPIGKVDYRALEQEEDASGN